MIESAYLYLRVGSALWTLHRVLCTVADRSLTLQAILSLLPHSEFAVLEEPSGSLRAPRTAQQCRLAEVCIVVGYPTLGSAWSSNKTARRRSPTCARGVSGRETAEYVGYPPSLAEKGDTQSITSGCDQACYHSGMVRISSCCPNLTIGVDAVAAASAATRSLLCQKDAFPEAGEKLQSP